MSLGRETLSLDFREREGGSRGHTRNTLFVTTRTAVPIRPLMADMATFERALGEVEYPKPVFQSPLQVVIFMSMCECAQALQHLRQATADECLV